MNLLIQFKFLFSVIVIFVLSIAYIPSIEGQEEDESIRLKYAQVIVRDSDGNLVTYLETTRIIMVEGFRVTDIINHNSTRIIGSEINQIEGIPHEIITFERNPPTEDHLVTRGITYLNKIIILNTITGYAFFPNNGYFLEPTDKLTVIWTAIRPI